MLYSETNGGAATDRDAELAKRAASIADALADTTVAERTRLLASAKMRAANNATDESMADAAAHDDEGYKAELVGFDTIEAKRTDWLWEGRIPRGMLSLLVGTEGLGKSAVTLALAAQLSLGKLAGDFKGEASTVALVTVDDPQRTMRPRLEAAGADLSRVQHFRLSKDGLDAGMMLPRDAGRLGRALGEAGVRLVIIDPLAATLDPRLNSYKDTDVREALTPLIAAAGEHDFAMLGVLHTNKNRTNDARERAMGSVGWRQVVRSALYLGVDPDDPEGKGGQGRAVAHDKCNVGRRARTVKVQLTEATVQVEGRGETLPRADFGEECEYSANDLFAAEAGVSEDKAAGKTRDASRLLYALLADGPKARSAIEEEAARRDISWRTVERAKEEAGVRSYRPAGSKVYVWELPGLEV